MPAIGKVPWQYHEQLQKQIRDRIAREYTVDYLNQTAFWITWVDGAIPASWDEKTRSNTLLHTIGCPPIPAGCRRIYTIYRCYYKEHICFLEYVDFPASEFKTDAFELSLPDGSALRRGI